MRIACLVAVFFSFVFGNAANLDISFDGGDDSERKIDVRKFHSVEVSGTFVIDYTQSLTQSLVLEGDSADLNRVIYEVCNGVLHISMPEDTPLTVIGIEICAPELRSFTASGACSLGSDFLVKQDDMCFSLSGASHVDLEVFVSGELKLDTSGTSIVNLEGVSEKLTLQVSGLCKVDAETLQVSKAKLNTSGMSLVNVWVFDDLSASASGMSKVSYKGAPQILDLQQSGMSVVKKD